MKRSLAPMQSRRFALFALLVFSLLLLLAWCAHAEPRVQRRFLPNRLRLLTCPSEATGSFALHLLLRLPPADAALLSVYSTLLSDYLADDTDPQAPAALLHPTAAALKRLHGRITVFPTDSDYFEIQCIGPASAQPLVEKFLSTLFNLARPDETYFRRYLLQRASDELELSLSRLRLLSTLDARNLLAGSPPDPYLKQDAFDTLHSLSCDDFYAFYHSVFSADKALVACVGTFDPASLARTLSDLPLRPRTWRASLRRLPGDFQPLDVLSLPDLGGAEVFCAWRVDNPSLDTLVGALLLAQAVGAEPFRLSLTDLLKVPVPPQFLPILARTTRAASLTLLQHSLLFTFASQSDPRVLRESYLGLLDSLSNAPASYSDATALAPLLTRTANFQALRLEAPADCAREMARFEVAGIDARNVFKLPQALLQADPALLADFVASLKRNSQAVIVCLPAPPAD